MGEGKIEDELHNLRACEIICILRNWSVRIWKGVTGKKKKLTGAAAKRIRVMRAKDARQA